MKLIDVTKHDVVYERELSSHQFIELLKSNAKINHEVLKRSPIFTDVSLKYKYSFVTPSAKHIKSPFWIDKLIETYNSWSNFPDRQSSIRGYTNMEQVGHETSVIIPFDGAKLGICPKQTFYRSFESLASLEIERVDNESLSEWIVTIASGINKILKTSISIDEIKSLESFNKRLIDIDQSINRLDLQRKLSDTDDLTDREHIFIRDILRRYVTSMSLYLNEKLDPNNNGFVFQRVENISKFRGDSEIWLNQPCLIIKRTDYIELMKD